MEVKIEKLDHQGRGIAFVGGVITFIPNTLIDETADIRIVKRSKKVNEGQVISLLTKSPKRVESKCKYYSVCGGCDLMHISYEDELVYKEEKVKEVLARFANVDSSLVKSIVPNSEYNYRNKATFQVKKNVGFYKKDTNDVVNITKCLIVDNRINELLEIFKTMDITNIYQILVRVSKKETMVVFKADEGYKINESLFKNVDCLMVYVDKKYKNLKGSGYITEEIGDYKFMISPDSFFQVNTAGAYNLYSKVKEYVGSADTLLDLYCGTGSIGIFLSDISKKVIGVEINEYAVADANRNKDLNKINNIEFICSDAGNINVSNVDVVVVDPPRSGLLKDALEYIIKLNPNKIVYVSCDPVTLGRDLKVLSENYNILEITPVDMFSKTSHIENVCKLVRK